MERLTDKRMKSEGFIPVDPKEYKAFIRNEKPTGKQIYQRLLDIEEILGDEYDPGHLRELVEADRNGRCVVLPCKVGDTIFYLTGKPSLSANPVYEKVETSVVAGFYWDNRGLQIRLRSFKGNHGTYGFYNETVFLTREAAEAALKGEQDGKQTGPAL